MGEPGLGRRVKRRTARDAQELGWLLTDGAERRRFFRRLRDPRKLSVRQQHAVILLILLAMAAAWAAGALALRAFAPAAARPWDAVWALGAVSFAAAGAIPVPGATTALLVALGGSGLQAWGVLGASVGGTLGAAVVYSVGGALRRGLERRAKKSRWSRRVLEVGERLARRGTYGAVALLISLPFVPRAPVLYLASVVELRMPWFLGAVFAGHLVRTSLVALGADAVASFL